MVTSNSKIKSRFDAGKDLTLKSALQLCDAEGKTLSALVGKGSVERAPERYREKPLYFVLRHLGITQQALAERSGLSLSAVHHALKGDDIYLSSVIAIAEGLEWSLDDVAKIISSEPETISATEFAARLGKQAGTMDEKAKKLNASSRTVRRWISGSTPIPSGIREELDNLGW
jgi:hypothetical protein